MGEAEMPLSRSSPVKSDQKNKKKKYHKRDTSIISSLLDGDDKLRAAVAVAGDRSDMNLIAT